VWKNTELKTWNKNDSKVRKILRSRELLRRIKRRSEIDEEKVTNLNNQNERIDDGN
jgi:hypothetical protein